MSKIYCDKTIINWKILYIKPSCVLSPLIVIRTYSQLIIAWKKFNFYKVIIVYYKKKPCFILRTLRKIDVKWDCKNLALASNWRILYVILYCYSILPAFVLLTCFVDTLKMLTHAIVDTALNCDNSMQEDRSPNLELIKSVKMQWDKASPLRGFSLLRINELIGQVYRNERSLIK